MPIKIALVNEIKPGSYIMIEDKSYIVKRIDSSKPGAHGPSKARIEAIGITDNRKKIVSVPGHERFPVPRVDKKRAQILAIGDRVSIMDSQSFENFEVEKPEGLEISEGAEVEYWDVEGQKVIKRIL